MKRRPLRDRLLAALFLAVYPASFVVVAVYSLRREFVDTFFFLCRVAAGKE
jgi:hypothetical protein